MQINTISFFHRVDKHAKKKFIKWTFKHNMSTSLEPAFESWTMRCDDATNPHDFIKYVKSKDVNVQITLLKQ